MKALNKTILLVAALVISLSGCKKSNNTAGPAGATGPAGPSLSGTLEGYVDLYDEYGTLITPLDGVSVTVAGKSGMDTTINSGLFTKSLSTGTYEIDFAKTGFGNYKIPSLNFVGGGTQYIANHVQLTKPATFSLTSITSATLSSGNVSVTVTPSNTDTKTRKVICFYSTNSTVSNDPSTYMGSFIVTIAANSATGTQALQAANANAVGIASGSGTLVYIAAYPIASITGASSYGDIATGKVTYNNLNTASMVTTSFNFP